MVPVSRRWAQDRIADRLVELERLLHLIGGRFAEPFVEDLLAFAALLEALQRSVYLLQKGWLVLANAEAPELFRHWLVDELELLAGLRDEFLRVDLGQDHCVDLRLSKRHKCRRRILEGQQRRLGESLAHITFGA